MAPLSGFAASQYPTLRHSLDITSAYSARSGESRCSRFPLCLGLNLSNHRCIAVYPGMLGGSTIMGNSCGISSEARPYTIDRVFQMCHNVVMRCRGTPAIVSPSTRLARHASILVYYYHIERRMEDV